MKLDHLFIGVLPPLSFSFIKNSVSGQLQFNESDNIHSVCLLHSHTGPADAACLEKKKVYLYELNKSFYKYQEINRIYFAIFNSSLTFDFDAKKMRGSVEIRCI